MLTDKELQLTHRLAEVVFKERVKAACRAADNELAPALAEQGFDTDYMNGWLKANMEKALYEHCEEAKRFTS